MHDENRPLLGWQPPESAFELVPVGHRERVVRDSRSVDRQETDVRAPGAHSAGLAVAGMNQEPLQPGVEEIRISEPPQLAPGDHQRLLNGILGSGDIPENSIRDGEEPVPARTSQDGKRLPVALLSLLHEVAIHLPGPSVRPIGGRVHWFKSGSPSPAFKNRARNPRRLPSGRESRRQDPRQAPEVTRRFGPERLQRAGGPEGRRAWRGTVWRRLE